MVRLNDLRAAAALAAWLLAAAWPAPAGADSLRVAFTTAERDYQTGVRSLTALADRVPATVDLFRIAADGGIQRVSTAETSQPLAQFDGLPPGEYLVQVSAEGFIGKKQRVTLGGDLKLSLELRRPLDFGNGPAPEGPPFAGSRYAFGCNVVSLIFVQFSGHSTWTDALRATTVTAATSGMTSFENQAPPEAHFSANVDTVGTYTVASTVGDTCGAAQAWIDEVFDQMGYTTGTVAERANQIARDRAAATCGASAQCSTCGLQNSGFLFFITRDNAPGNVGGWNCGGTYQISYFGNSDDQVVYVHEIGHAFGTNDEYCTNLGGTNGMYCCGWPSTSTSGWGCNNTGGCLSVGNANCDPLCGADCVTSVAGIQDCQDGCPAANCTTHTPCAMDGSGTLTFCDVSRRQLGWVESDCDGALDCLETDCGTSPSNIGSVPGAACIPPKFNGVFVDKAWTGIELGTAANPFNTVWEGYSAASTNQTLNIRPGVYPENIPLAAGKNIHAVRWGCSGSVVMGQ